MEFAQRTELRSSPSGEQFCPAQSLSVPGARQSPAALLEQEKPFTQECQRGEPVRGRVARKRN